MGGMMAGQAVLEYGYDAAVWSAPYVKSAAIATYNAGKYAYTVSSNAAKYYGSTAIINGVKGYGKTKMMAEIGYMAVNNHFWTSVITGAIDGGLRYVTECPPDAPYILDNPVFQLSSDLLNWIISIKNK